MATGFGSTLSIRRVLVVPPIARLLEHVDGGAVGNIQMVHIREHRFPFLLKVESWNRFNENTGGTLVYIYIYIYIYIYGEFFFVSCEKWL